MIFINNIITIENISLIIKEYLGTRVVTFKDIDILHQRTLGTAKRNFNRKKIFFIKNVDYFEIFKSDLAESFTEIYGFDRKAPKGILITETGYLMLTKSLTDELAWKIQRILVNNYFRQQHYNIIYEQLENILEYLQNEAYLINKKTDVLIEQGFENNRLSHKSKLELNKIINLYASSKPDKELLKTVVLYKFGVAKWQDLSYSKKLDIIKCIRDSAIELGISMAN